MKLNREGLPKGNKRGFTTVYLVMILSSLVMAVVMIINAACGYAARSAVDSVSSLAGRSVLSEYQKDLYRRYGIFALRADDAMLSRLASFYINGSLVTTKALVRPVAVKVNASAESYPALDTSAFGKQVKRLAPAAAITKGRVFEYITKFAAQGASGGALPEGLNDGDPVEDGSKVVRQGQGPQPRKQDPLEGLQAATKQAPRIPEKDIAAALRRTEGPVVFNESGRRIHNGAVLERSAYEGRLLS